MRGKTICTNLKVGFLEIFSLFSLILIFKVISNYYKLYTSKLRLVWKKTFGKLNYLKKLVFWSKKYINIYGYLFWKIIKRKNEHFNHFYKEEKFSDSSFKFKNIFN